MLASQPKPPFCSPFPHFIAPHVPVYQNGIVIWYFNRQTYSGHSLLQKYELYRSYMNLHQGIEISQSKK